MFNFFFESDEDKKIREDVENHLQICMQNPKKYEGSKQMLEIHVNKSNQKVIQKIVDNVKSTIKDDDMQPVRKYQAILLLRDLMRSHNKALGKYVVTKILKRLTILAQHKNGTAEEADEERGRDIFGRVKRDQEQYSIKFLNTLLSAMEEWGKSWPKNPDGPYKDFHRQYNQLVMSKVRFPKKESIKPQASRSISPIQTKTGKSLEKKPSSISNNRKVQISPPVRDIGKPGLKPALAKQLTSFYGKMIEPIGLFSQCLQEATMEEFPFLRDIANEIQKASEKGNQLIIQLEDQSSNGSDAKKLESIFTFIESLQKNLKVVARNPDKFDKFRVMFVKSSKSTIKLLQSKDPTSSKIKNNEPEKPSTSTIKRQQTPKPIQKIEQPKIKNKNRYTSVSGGGIILEQFQQNNSDQPKQNSVHSDRFGSGGINSQRHRAAPNLTSPRGDGIIKRQRDSSGNKNQVPPRPKKNKQADSIQEIKIQEIVKQVETKTQVEIKKKPKEIKTKTVPVLQPQKVQKNEPIKQQKVVPQSSVISKQDQSLTKSDNFFKQFNPSSSKDLKNIVNPLKDSDSFRNFGAEQNVPKEEEQDDFFTNIQKNKQENNANNVNNINNVRARRKVVKPKQGSQKDMFENKEKSQLSDGLSAFQIPKAGPSEISDLKPNTPQGQVSDSKKSINFDNPFGTGMDAVVPKVNQEQSLNFFNDFQQKSERNSTTNVLNLEGQNIQNRFQTGNFGGAVEEVRRRKESLNPFETESQGSQSSQKIPYMSSANPFRDQSFERISNGSKKVNPFDTKNQPPSDPILQTKASRPENPFETKSEQPSNPFETSTNKEDQSPSGIQSILDIFKPPTNKVIEDLSQRGSFKEVQKFPPEVRYSGEKEDVMKQSGMPGRDSLMFAVNVEKQSENGLNFSQFQDLPGGARASKSSEFAFPNTGQKKSNQHQQSGFSLSNFAPVGGPDPFVPSARNSNLVNTNDFFGGFSQKNSSASVEDVLVKKEKVPEQNIKATVNFFDDFNMSKSDSKISIEKKSDPRPMENEKTVISNSQKSFDFSQLQNTSKIQKKSAKKGEETFEVRFSDFGSMKITEEIPKKEVKQQFNQTSEANWGVFDKAPSQNQFDTFKSNMLEVQSRNGDKPQDKDAIISDREIGSKFIRTNQQSSLNLNLQDFTPISKKGIAWNPLSQIPNLKAPSFVYMIDEQKLKTKKLELQQQRQEHSQTTNIFRIIKEKNEKIRTKYLQKMTAVDVVISQKSQYQQILKKLKQGNDIKQKQIGEVNKKIKAVQQLKSKIIKKEKQLYELTKNQMKIEDRKTPIQRTMASKWQLFNKNLQHQRNNAFTMTRLSYQGY